MKTARVIAWCIIPFVLVIAGVVLLLAEGCVRTFNNLMDFIEILVRLDRGEI